MTFKEVIEELNEAGRQDSLEFGIDPGPPDETHHKVWVRTGESMGNCKIVKLDIYPHNFARQFYFDLVEGHYSK